MTSSVRCMGISLYVSPHAVFCHAHPSTLNARGALKFSAQLQSFWATGTHRTTNVFLSELCNTLPFLHSWGAFFVIDWDVDASSGPFKISPGDCVRIHASRSAPPDCENALGRPAYPAVGCFYRVSPAAQSLAGTVQDLVTWLQ